MISEVTATETDGEQSTRHDATHKQQSKPVIPAGSRTVGKEDDLHYLPRSYSNDRHMRHVDRSKKLTSIGHTIRTSQNPVLAEAVNRYRALTPLNTAWTNSVDQTLRRHARPVDLKNGTLTVHVDSSVWANLLRNTEQSIVAGLRNSGLDEIQSLNVRISPPTTLQTHPPAGEDGGNNLKLSRLFAKLRKALD